MFLEKSMIPKNIKEIINGIKGVNGIKIHVEASYTGNEPGTSNKTEKKLYELIEKDGVFSWRRIKGCSVRIW